MAQIPNQEGMRRRKQPKFGKVDIVHILADRYGYRRYLEIATATTGNYYFAIDRARFEDCRRLLYRCPEDFDDGRSVDYRTPGADIADIAASIASEPQSFDLMLVDPFHTYADSLRDIESAFALLVPGGAMVVHDCMPPSEETADPEFTTGAWCGVTYKAFLDFVLNRTDLRYCTVDADYGCGVIRKLSRPWHARIRDTIDLGQRRRINEWNRVGDDFAKAWRCFDANKKQLLRLVDAGAFRNGGVI